MAKKLFLTTAFLLTFVFASQAQLLWKVSGNGSKGDSYLFGTHHFAPNNILDDVEGLEDAILQSDVVIGEIVMDQINMADVQRYVMSEAMAPSDSLLTMVLSPEQITKVNSKLKKLSGGMLSVEAFKMVKPIVVALQIAIFEALDNLNNVLNIGTGQIDTLIQSFAKENNIPTDGFETMEQQTKMLLGGSIREQVDDLMKQVENEGSNGNSDNLNSAYINRDLTELEKIMDEEFPDKDSAKYHRLVSDRNARWIKRIQTELPKRNVFVVVGAAHLVGADGLITQLRDLGYTLTPVDKKR